MLCSVTRLCLILCNPMDCNPPGYSVHGVSQARILEYIAFPSPGDHPDPGIKLTFPVSPALAGGFFAAESPGKPLYVPVLYNFLNITLWHLDNLRFNY